MVRNFGVGDAGGDGRLSSRFRISYRADAHAHHGHDESDDEVGGFGHDSLH